MKRLLLAVVLVACASIARAESKECSNGYAPKGVAWSPSGTDVSATLTSICNDGRGSCKRLAVYNFDTTNAAMIQINSSDGAWGICVPAATSTALPAVIDVSEWVADSTRISAVYATTTGTTSCPSGVTVGAPKFELVGCP